MREIFGIFGKKRGLSSEGKTGLAGEDAVVSENFEDTLQEHSAKQSSSERALHAKIQLEEILKRMGFEAAVSVRESEDTVWLDMKGVDMGRLIGKEGNTLNALQCLLGGMLGKKYEEKFFVKVDANNYREKREQALRRMARDAAQMAVFQKKPVELEPMTPNERRIIHDELNGSEEVHTYSKGERYERRIIVAPGAAAQAQENLSAENVA